MAGSPPFRTFRPDSQGAPAVKKPASRPWSRPGAIRRRGPQPRRVQVNRRSDLSSSLPNREFPEGRRSRRPDPLGL